MSFAIKILPDAEADIREAVMWYESQKIGLGERFVESLNTVFTLICERPASFPIVHRDIRRALTKRFPFGVFFLLEEDTVMVLAVYHASRDPRNWKNRLN